MFNISPDDVASLILMHFIKSAVKFGYEKACRTVKTAYARRKEI